MCMIRRLVKAGDGGALILDSALQALTGWKLGDRLRVEVTRDGCIALIPLAKQSSNSKRRRT